jgi:hypothetical protein
MNGSALGTTVQYIVRVKPGDSNVDNVVNILDVQHALNKVLGSNPCPFNTGAADVNKDLSVNILDLVLSINIIQNNAMSSPPAGDGLRADHSFNAEITVENKAVYLETTTDIAAFDIRFRCENPESITFDYHGFSASVTEKEGVTSIIAFSPEGNVIPAGKVKLFDCRSIVEFTGAILSDKEAVAVPVKIQATVTGLEATAIQDTKLFNTPNPFRENTALVYTLSEDVSAVRIVIRNLQGSIVAILTDIPTQPGENRIEYTPQGLPAGIYPYTLEIISNDKKVYHQTKKLIIQ